MHNPEEDRKDFCLDLSDVGKSSKSQAMNKTKEQAATARVTAQIALLDLKTEPVDDLPTQSAASNANEWGSTKGMEIVKQTINEARVLPKKKFEKF